MQMPALPIPQGVPADIALLLEQSQEIPVKMRATTSPQTQGSTQTQGSPQTVRTSRSSPSINVCCPFLFSTNFFSIFLFFLVGVFCFIFSFSCCSFRFFFDLFFLFFQLSSLSFSFCLISFFQRINHHRKTDQRQQAVQNLQEEKKKTTQLSKSLQDQKIKMKLFDLEVPL